MTSFTLTATAPLAPIKKLMLSNDKTEKLFQVMIKNELNWAFTFSFSLDGFPYYFNTVNCT